METATPVSFDDLDTDLTNVSIKADLGEELCKCGWRIRPGETCRDCGDSRKPEQTFMDAQVKAANTVVCPRCRGNGKYGYYGTCFKCKGGGRISATVYKREVTRVTNDTNRRLEYYNSHQAIITKIEHLVARRNPFGIAMANRLRDYGELTEPMEQAIQRMLDQDLTRAQTREANAPNVQGAGFDKMVTAFTKAASTGLKRPTLKCGDLVFSLASQTSKNPGYIYVKIGGNYQGKISPVGKYMASFGTLPEVTAKVEEVAKDPYSAAIQHGRLTGCCAICSRQLTDPESVSRGVGPICAERFGWL